MNQASRQALARFKAAYEEWQEELRSQVIPMREGEKSILELTIERFPSAYPERQGR